MTARLGASATAGRIRTVEGDRDFTADPGVGAVAAFAHVVADWRALADRGGDDPLPSEMQVEEARTTGDALLAAFLGLRARGVGLVLDATPPGSGRDPMRLHDLAQASGIAIVACTGAHAHPTRLARVEERSGALLAEWFAFEIGMGIAAVAGDRMRGMALLSDRATGAASDVLNDAAIRAGAIRITFASAILDRTDRNVLEAAAITAAAMGVATFIDAPPGTDLREVASRFEQDGGDPSRLILVPGSRLPEDIVAAAGLGFAVVVPSPATDAEGPVAMWSATLRGLARTGLLDRAMATFPVPAAIADDPVIVPSARANGLVAPVDGLDDRAMEAVAARNALRLLCLSS